MFKFNYSMNLITFTINYLYKLNYSCLNLITLQILVTFTPILTYNFNSVLI